MEEAIPPFLNGHKSNRLESVGESMKTILSRLTQVRAGANIDEFGDSLNDVEKVLNNLGVSLRDSVNSFRPMGDVIDEIAAKWQSYTEIERSQIATAVAGIRQRNTFIALMQNYNKVLEAQKIELDATGLATQRFGIYLDSVEAHANKFKASWEALWSSTINDDAIKSLYDLGTAVLDLITKLGGLYETFKKLTIVMNPFLALLYKINDEMGRGQKETNKQNADLQQTIDGLKQGSKGYDDYAEKVKKAVEAVGYHVDAEGKIYRTIQTSRGEIHYYIDDVNALSVAEYNVETATGAMDAAFQRWLDTQQKAKDGFTPQQLIDLKNAFSELATYVDGPLISTFNDYNNKQIELKTKAAELEAKIKEALTYPASTERDRELFDLRQSLEETNKAISANADAYDLATKRILFDMLLQKLGQMQLSEDVSAAAYNMVYNLGAAWGLFDQGTVKVMGHISSVLANLSNSDVPAAVASLQGLSSWLNSIVGNYYVNIIVRTLNNPSSINSPTGAERGGPGTYVPRGNQTNGLPGQANPVTTPPGGYYPSGFGGGGGGGGKEAKEEQVSMQNLFNMIINLIKQQKQAEIDLLNTRKDALEAEQDALDQQLDSYKNIIDSRKEILRTEQDELSYQEDIADRNKSIARLQQELAIAMLDNSLEGQSRQLELQDQLNKEQEDLTKKQRDHSYDEQEKALDKEYSLYEDQINKQKDLLEEQKKAIDEQIAKIDEFLSKSGLIAQEALDVMAEKAPSLYQDLIDWNAEYGSGIKADVTDAWDEAYKALKKYGDLVSALKGEAGYGGGSGTSTGSGGGSLNWKRKIGLVEGTPLWDEAIKLGKTKFLEKYPEYHHAGLSSGPVGGMSTSVNEVFTKLFKGEVVLNQTDMINAIRKIGSFIEKPNTPMANGGGDITIENLINVEGNLDSSVIPSLEKLTDSVIKKFNSTLIKRGYNRNVQLYSS